MSLSSSIGDLFVRIGLAGLPDFHTALNGVSGALTKAVRDADNSARGFDRMGSALTGLGTTLTAALTLPIAGVGIAATKMASDFELGIRKVGSLVGGFTDGELKEMEQGVLALAKSMGIDAVKATDALYQAISAGVPKENALEFLKVASEAAIAGVTDTKVAVDGLTSIINAYGLQASDAKEVSDAMFQSVNLGKFEFADLASSISIAIPLAAQLGIGFKDVLAAAATLTSQGFSVSEAMTSIRAAMVAIISPNKAMNELFAEAGVTSGQALLQTKGLQGSLEVLRETVHGNIGALTDALGRVEGLGAVLSVTGDKADTAHKHLDSVRNSMDGVGASTQAFNEINKSTSRQFDILVNNLKSTAIELGLSLLPTVNELLKASQPFVQFLSDAAKWFGNLPTPVKELTIAFAAALAVIGPLTVGMGLTFSAVGSLISGFGALTGAMAAINFSAMGTAIATVASTITGSFIGPLTAGQTLLLSFAQASIVAAGAFAGWKFGEWLGGMKLVQDAFDLFVKSIPGAEIAIQKLTGAYKPLKEAQEGTVFTITKMEEALARHGVTVDKAGLSAEQYAEKLRAAIKQLSDSATATTKVVAPTENLATALKKAQAEAAKLTPTLKAGTEQFKAQKTSTDILKESLAKYEAELRDVKKSHDAGIASAEAVARAQQKVKDILTALTPEIDRQKISWAGWTLAADGVTHVMDELPPFILDVTEAVKSMDEVWAETSLVLGNVKFPVNELGEAFKTLGIVSSEELKRTADKAKEALDTIVAAYGETSPQVEAAVAVWAEAHAKYLRSIGDEQGAAELERALGTQVGKHQAAATQVHTIWTDMAADLRTAIGTVSNTIGDMIVNGEFSLSKLGDAFKDAFANVAKNAISTLISEGLNFLMDKLDDLLGMIPGVGSALGGVFGGLGGAAGTAGGIATPPITTTSGIPGLGGGTSSTGGAASSLGSFASIFGMVTGAISAITDILGLFGVGQAGQKDRLTNISDATKYMAWAFDAGGMRGALLDLKNDTHNFVNDAFGGWYKTYLDAVWEDVFATRIASQSIDAKLGYLWEFAYASWFDMQVKLGEIVTNTAAMASAAPKSAGVTVIVQGNFYGNEEAARQLTALIGAELRLQGQAA